MLWGWQKIGGSWYYLGDHGDGAMKIGWVKSGTKWYHLNESGKMDKGWIYSGSKWYYLSPISGAMKTGWMKDGGGWYYLDNMGIMKIGWQKINKRWYYLHTKGNMLWGWERIDGYWYYLGAHDDGAMKTGWVNVGDRWYYLYLSGIMASKVWIGGKYYLGSSGLMYINSWTPDGYYVGDDGAWIRGKKREVVERGNFLIKNPERLDVLVNKVFVLPSIYSSGYLVYPKVRMATSRTSNMLREEAALALEILFNEAEKNGHIIYARSGYRSYNTQKSIFADNVKRKGNVEKANRSSAKAGQSEHQTGLAMDISTKGLNYELKSVFGMSKEGKWVAANAYKYGFIVRYPNNKESITGYIYEPWHIRFIGIDLATKVYKSGLTYEEYLGY